MAWTKDELNVLFEKYANTSNKELGRLVNKPAQTVYSMAHSLGLKKSPEFMARHAGEVQENRLIKAMEGERRIHSGFLAVKGNITVHRMV